MSYEWPFRCFFVGGRGDEELLQNWALVCVSVCFLVLQQSSISASPKGSPKQMGSSMTVTFSCSCSKQLQGSCCLSIYCSDASAICQTCGTRFKLKRDFDPKIKDLDPEELVRRDQSRLEWKESPVKQTSAAECAFLCISRCKGSYFVAENPKKLWSTKFHLQDNCMCVYVVFVFEWIWFVLNCIGDWHQGEPLMPYWMLICVLNDCCSHSPDRIGILWKTMGTLSL